MELTMEYLTLAPSKGHKLSNISCESTLRTVKGYYVSIKIIISY